MGPRVELIAGMLEVPRVSSLSPMASAGTEEWGHARARLPAEAEGGNPGEYSGESPEGVETRQEDLRMPKTTAITSHAGKGGGGLQTGGRGRQARKAGTTQPRWSEDLWAQGGGGHATGA